MFPLVIVALVIAFGFVVVLNFKYYSEPRAILVNSNQLSINTGMKLAEHYYLDLSTLPLEDEESAKLFIASNWDKPYTDITVNFAKRSAKLKLILNHPETKDWTLADWDRYLINPSI